MYDGKTYPWDDGIFTSYPWRTQFFSMINVYICIYTMVNGMGSTMYMM